MKTLVLANQKGGVGKTASLVHFAWYAAEAGKKVVVLDFDPQGNASRTLSNFISKIPSEIPSSDILLSPEEYQKIPNIPASDYLLKTDAISPLVPKETDNIALIASNEELADVERQINYKTAIYNLRLNLKRLEALGFDLCLIDTPPTLGVLMIAAIGTTDFILSPIEMESYSIDGIEKLWKKIEGISDEENPKVEFLGMFPSRLNGGAPRHKKTLKRLLEINPDMVLNYPIGLRINVGDALAAKKAVWHLKRTDGKAANEIRALAGFVFKKMEILQ